MYDSTASGVSYDMTSPNIISTSDSCRFQAIKEHLFSELRDEAVILSLENGIYYGLNAVGVSIWKAIQAPATIQDIETAVMQEYDVTHETLHEEVLSFLKKMADEKLIEIVHEESA